MVAHFRLQDLQFLDQHEAELDGFLLRFRLAQGRPIIPGGGFHGETVVEGFLGVGMHTPD